jgi:beta-phosphoglucomutase
MKKSKEVAQYIAMTIKDDTILFFDMDGTLVDTNLSNFLAYKKAIFSVTKSDHNLTYNPAFRLNRTSIKNILPNLSKSEYEKIIEEKEGCYLDFLNETSLNSSIVDILLKYSKTNMTVLVTNCRKDRAMSTLKYFSIEDKFDRIFCREFSMNDEKINKFQNAISKLGILPNLVTVFENEAIEIEDAKIAGIKTIINTTYI